jgi:uncharacterized protein YcbK (DUF882 family)
MPVQKPSGASGVPASSACTAIPNARVPNPLDLCRRSNLARIVRVMTGATALISMPAIATTRKSGCTADDTTMLKLHHLHTGERLAVRVQLAGNPINPSEQQGFDRFARDHYNGQALTMDPALVQLLATVQYNLRCRDLEFEVVSGYRSPVTNQRLLRMGRGVDRNSFHMRGQAIDVRMWGVPLASIRDAALELQAGGVGYYPRSSFVHIDTGPVRRW